LGAEGFLADGRADRHNEANSRFSQFCDENKNYYTTLIYVPRTNTAWDIGIQTTTHFIKKEK